MFYQEVKNAKKGTVIDVRSSEEFQLGHAKGSVNIPWDLHLLYLEELERLPRPWMFCCEEGVRAGLVEFSLRTIGYKGTCNIGRWQDVKIKTYKP